MNTDLSLYELIVWLNHNTNPNTPCEGCGEVVKIEHGQKMIIGMPLPICGSYRFYTYCIRCMERSLAMVHASGITRGNA